jgi:hypothetical protein
MKTTLLFSVLAAVAAPLAFAADVSVMGPATKSSDAKTDVRVASKDLLNRATGLLNKNTLAMDNNIFIARSNIIFTQNDRLMLRDKVKQALKKEQAMTTATLTKDVLRAVSSSDKDTALMTKASGVVAAKDADAPALAARIADFVDAAATREMEKEQAIQSQTPRGIVVMVGTKDLLRQPTAAINKNVAASDNQIMISRTTISPTQNDQVVLTGGAKVADAVLPAAAVTVGKVTKVSDEDESEDSKDSKGTESEPMYRTRFAYPKEGEADVVSVSQEQFLGGFGGLGWGLGWRYPLGYWNAFGAGLYGGGCGLGFGFGGFYYC